MARASAAPWTSCAVRKDGWRRLTTSSEYRPGCPVSQKGARWTRRGGHTMERGEAGAPRRDDAGRPPAGPAMRRRCQGRLAWLAVVCLNAVLLGIAPVVPPVRAGLPPSPTPAVVVTAFTRTAL